MVQVKVFAKKNGYKVSIWNHFGDIPNALDLALNKTANSKIRKESGVLLIGLVIGVIIFVYTFFSFRESTDEWRCRRYNEFLAHETNRRVIEKFIDKENHSLEAFIIKNENTEDKETEIPLCIDDFYEKTNIGDTIIKEKNSAYVTIKDGQKKLVLANTNNPCKIK